MEDGGWWGKLIRLFLQNRPDPSLMVEIPPDGFPDALLKFVNWGPAEVTLNLGGIYGVPTVMAGPVLDEGDELSRISARLR